MPKYRVCYEIDGHDVWSRAVDFRDDEEAIRQFGRIDPGVSPRMRLWRHDRNLVIATRDENSKPLSQGWEVTPAASPGHR